MVSEKFISHNVYSLTLGGFSPPCVKGGVSGRSEQLNYFKLNF